MGEGATVAGVNDPGIPGSVSRATAQARRARGMLLLALCLLPACRTLPNGFKPTRREPFPTGVTVETWLREMGVWDDGKAYQAEKASLQ